MQSQDYRPDIDGLRALAVLAVLGFHAFPALLPGGFVGVDIFFVISGFLISGILLRQSAAGRLSIADFYARRVKRIFPGLALVLAATLVLGWCVLSPEEWKTLGGDVAAGAGFLSNLRLWQQSGYFDHAALSKPLLHLWSLGIEEQFYILWPLAILFFAPKRRVFGVLLPALIVASMAANLWWVWHSPSSAFYLPITRFWELLAGAWLAARGPLGSSPLRGWLGTALLLGSILLLDEHRLFPGGWALLPVAGAFLLLSAGPEAWPNRRIFSHPAMVFIGLISYPLYLWHWPLLTYARLILFHEPPTAARVALLLASGLLAWLTYRVLERPIRHSQGWRAPLALCAVVALLALAGLLAGPHWQRSPGALGPVYASMESGLYGDLAGEGCGFPASTRATLSFCRSDKRATPHRVLVGDSHAGALYPALQAESRTGEGWILMGRAGCLPAPDLERLDAGDPGDARACREAAAAMVPAIAHNPAIGEVLLAFSARVTGTLREELSEGRPQRYGPQADAVALGLSESIAKWTAAGKHVTLLIDNPALPDPQNCIREVAGFGIRTNPACAISRAEADSDFLAYRALLAEIRRRSPQLDLFDPTDLLCPQNQCRVINNGISWYSYTDHLSDSSGRIVARGLLAHLRGEATR